jgi:hypothetical protein
MLRKLLATLIRSHRPGAASGWPLTCDGRVPGCRALDVLGELDPRSRANVDHRPVRVLGVPDGDQCLAGPDFDAVAVGSAVGGLPPVYLGHITYCDRSITLREQPTAPHVRSVTNSLHSAHAGHRQTRGRGRSGSKLFDRRGGKSVLAGPELSPTAGRPRAEKRRPAMATRGVHGHLGTLSHQSSGALVMTPTTAVTHGRQRHRRAGT